MTDSPHRKRRSPKLSSAVNAAATPVFFVDERRKLAYVNAGLEELTGWSDAEILGTVCEYASDARAGSREHLAAGLCPPPEVFRGRPASVPAYLGRKDGSTVARLISYVPLFDEQRDVAGVMGLVTEIEPPRRTASPSLARELHAELAALRADARRRCGLRQLVGRGPAHARVLAQVELARTSRVPLLLVGERGVGKEHLARSLHAESELRPRSFVPVDCDRLPAREVRATLRRAFEAGDAAAREGAAVPGALPGTIYLIDVEHLSRDVQEQIVERYQAVRPEERFPAGLRLMASSRTRLDDALRDESLREDFFLMLTALTVELPPLRQRREDIDLLAQSILESLNRGDERQLGGFTDAVMEQFRRYNWPGNLDEMTAVIREARQAAKSDVVDASDLPFRFRTGQDAQQIGAPAVPRPMPLDEMLAAFESEQIQLALAQAAHNKTEAARLLGISRVRLYNRMKALGLADDGDEEPGGALTDEG